MSTPSFDTSAKIAAVSGHKQRAMQDECTRRANEQARMQQALDWGDIADMPNTDLTLVWFSRDSTFVEFWLMSGDTANASDAKVHGAVNREPDDDAHTAALHGAAKALRKARQQTPPAPRVSAWEHARRGVER